MPLGFMSWQLYTKILDQLPSNIVIVPFFRGESLLHPQFVDAMEKLKKFKEVQLATNGDMLHHIPTTTAILNVCTFVSVSLHKFKLKPTYDDISEFLHSAKNEDVTTQVSILETLIPQEKKQEFIEAWLQIVNQVRIYEEHSHIGYGDILRKIKDNDNPCLKPFNDMVVYWDGKIALCNHDWQNSQPLGDLNTQTINEVWSSEAYQTIRNKHKEGKRRQVQSCRNCDFWSKQTFGELYTNGTRIGTDDS